MLTALGTPEAAAGSRLGGAPCTHDKQCLSKKCFERSQTCSCDKIHGYSLITICQQPPERCQRATCNLTTHHCVTTNKTGGILECGVGGCKRSILQCVNGVEQVCTPGEPSPERCNAIDDDCDGVVDNGDACADECGPGGVCHDGRCTCAQ